MKYKNYEEYIDFQKTKTTDPVRREKWLNEEWDLKLNGFNDVFFGLGTSKEIISPTLIFFEGD